MHQEDVFKHAAIGIAKLGLDGGWLSVNSKFSLILGYSMYELHQFTFQDITHPDYLEADLVLFNQLIAGEIEEYQLEKRYFHKNSNIIWINTIISLVKDLNKKPCYFIVVIEDISDRKCSLTELKNAKRFIDRTVNSSLAGIYIYNIHQGINEFINKTYTDITGYTIGDLNKFIPEEFAELFHKDDRDQVFNHMSEVENAVDESYFEIEYRFKKKAGGWVWCLSRDKIFTWHKNNKAKSFTGTFIDITKIKNLELKLNDQALRDYLTGVDNRRSLNEKLTQEFSPSLRYKRSLSLLMIDIDNFKEINDTYGHSIGDEVLVILALKIKKIVRDSDTIGRYGGDEFIVILPEVDREQALVLAERIRKEFEKSTVDVIKKNNRKITISTGISTLSDNLYSSSDDLIKSADEALYKAKKSLRNNVK